MSAKRSTTRVACPICAAQCEAKHGDSPYWICPTCDAWFQHPAPPKVYAGAHEPEPEAMSDLERQVNHQLADDLFARVMGGKRGRTLDVGAKYPVLASRLAHHGCDAVAIDGDLRVTDYARKLGVVGHCLDFETMDEVLQRFDLITFVHVFEHLYDPIESLRKLRRMLTDDGAVFIRMPDHRVPGFERDLTAGHYTIHPFFHTLTSLLQALAESGTFAMVEDSPLTPGQRDLVLRPIAARPTICLATIARNEERDLPRMVSSAQDVVDDFVLVDTGSTDNTMRAGSDAWGADKTLAAAKTLDFAIYTGASKFIEGQWKIQDFSKARNHMLELARQTRCDYVLWMDADDELLTPQAIRRAAYYRAADVFGCWIEDRGSRWIQHRMWRMDAGVRFEGACHEYPVLDGLRAFNLDDCTIAHHAEPGAGQEDSNARNLRILTAEWERSPNARTAFYLANTHKDAGRHAEALPWYDKRIAMGPAHRDEWLFAFLYGARSARLAGEVEQAEALLESAILAEPSWAEFHVEHAFCAYSRGDYDEAIARALRAPRDHIPITHLWREATMYRDQPLRLVSWCYEHLGEMQKALEWGEQAAQAIGGPDAEWDARLARLRAAGEPRLPPPPKIRAIALHRPGAIGDILMTLNLIPALKDANPGLQVHYFCDVRLAPPEQLGSTLRAAGVDQIMDCAHWERWAPRYERAVNLVGYPLAEGYPQHPMRRHLIHYFAKECGLPARMHALELRRPTRPADAPAEPYATLQQMAGWSKYKQWHSWLEVVEGLPFPIIPIGEAYGRTLSHSIALVANAAIHLGIDSFANHLTHYHWTDARGGRKVPAVIVWGSTQHNAAGYLHNTNLRAGLWCQPCFRENPALSRVDRGPCINPPRASYEDDTAPACMAAISVPEVTQAALALWEKTVNGKAAA